MRGTGPPAGALRGRRVLVTRRWPELMAGLAADGAIAHEVPLVELRPPSEPGPLDEALRGLARYRWLVFTSANAVEAVAARMTTLGVTLETGIRLASVGPATTQAIDRVWPGTEVAIAPATDFRGAGLVTAFQSEPLDGQRILLPVSDRAAETVERGLSVRGARVDRVIAYRTVATGGEGLGEHLRAGVDVAVFASPSAVEVFVSAAGENGRGVPAAVIGPTTAEAARA
ncbi:MAG TPA: uroporphyrinogen-III synthase, partial [Vicinamibacteria bacterium]|nr:uroporphyrinogen-III synthase [Vicinamibacteria bacterium]